MLRRFHQHETAAAVRFLFFILLEQAICGSAEFLMSGAPSDWKADLCRTQQQRKKEKEDRKNEQKELRQQGKKGE